MAFDSLNAMNITILELMYQKRSGISLDRRCDVKKEARDDLAQAVDLHYLSAPLGRVSNFDIALFPLSEYLDILGLWKWHSTPFNGKISC